MTKPAPFDYLAAHTLDEALEALADGYGDAVVLAGGQTLVPLLALRLSLPSVLVDINQDDPTAVRLLFALFLRCPPDFQ